MYHSLHHADFRFSETSSLAKSETNRFRDNQACTQPAMRHKDLLHSVNNQLEIITSAAELFILRGADDTTRDLCSKIRLAALNTSAALSPHFRLLISDEETVKPFNHSSNPAPGKRVLPSSPGIG